MQGRVPAKSEIIVDHRKGIQRVRFGICSRPEQAHELAAAGFDYVEWGVNQTVGEMNDAEYSALREVAGSLSVRPEVWNLMLPHRIKVVGPDRDHHAMRQYLGVAFTRVAELGGRVVVFGSGPSRRVPDEHPFAEAYDEFATACRISGEVAAKHGITIAIEPLNRNSSNLVNRVGEGAALVDQIAHPAVRLLSDLFHVTIEAEPLQETRDAGTRLVHIHVAAPDQGIPAPGHGEQELRDYFATLRAAGYDDRVSLEVKWSDISEAAAGLRFLHDVWNAS
jgi:sugar phosphate isomerase/epimerase